MKTNNCISLILTLFLVLCGPLLIAQYQPGQHLLVKTTDAGTLIGTFVEENESILTMETTSLGLVNIQRSSIKSIKEIREGQIKDGKYWFENPNATRNLYSPTAYGLRKGEGYYQNTWIVLNTVSYGVTDWFTIGGGMELVSIFNQGTGAPAFIITPKVSFPIIEEQLHAGGGILYLNFTGLEGSSDGQLGILYGVGTYGSRDKNLTFGAGWSYSGYDGWANYPTFTLSGSIRTGRSFGLVSENWIVHIDGDLTPILSFGGRYMAEKVSVDLALVFVVVDSFVPTLPWLGVVIPFGND